MRSRRPRGSCPSRSNKALTYDNATSTNLTGVDAVRADAKLTKRNGNLPVAGHGVTVLVNDSGIDGSHLDHRFGPHLVQNVEAATNLHAVSELAPVTYVENVENTDATGGHGTHVAGIVGATGFRSNGKYEGVAPGAKLVGYGSGAGLAILDVIGGFDYAIANKDRYGIDVITNSWGDTDDSCTPVDPTHPVTRATYDTFKAGIAVVFSAGNSGPDPCTISGNYKKAPWVISVAAGDKDRALTDFSSRGTAGGGGQFTLDGKTWTWEDRPTLTAPGNLIISTRTVSPIGVLGTPDDVLAGLEPAYLPYYTTLSGTSMAAPHVAGVVALMLDAKPALTPLQLKAMLQATATPMPVRGVGGGGRVRGRVRGREARLQLDRAGRGRAARPLPPFSVLDQLEAGARGVAAGGEAAVRRVLGLPLDLAAERLDLLERRVGVLDLEVDDPARAGRRRPGRASRP